MSSQHYCFDIEFDVGAAHYRAVIRCLGANEDSRLEPWDVGEYPGQALAGETLHAYLHRIGDLDVWGVYGSLFPDEAGYQPPPSEAEILEMAARELDVEWYFDT